MNAGIGTRMYKTLRLSVLARILDDKAAVRGAKASGFITLRSYSGKNGENDRKTEIVPFYTFLDNQINQARRSLLFDVETTKNYEQLITLCEKFGQVKCMICSVLSKGNRVALIELADRQTYQLLLSGAVGRSEKCLPRMPSPFVCADYSSLVVTLTNFVISNIKHVDMSHGSVNWKQLPKSKQTLWTLYKDEKMNELSLRLRFLVVAQMNNIFGGLWSNAVVFPFGGSVNGFGSRFSDLDLTVIFRTKESRKFLTFKSKQSNDESQPPQSRYVRVISKILKDFAPGCDFVFPISSARVPIVKFYQEFVDLECDLSVESDAGLISTEILYIISYLHSLVKPLVIVIKKWAKEVNITSKTPGKQISNYGLLSMVVFFLQQRQVGNLDLLPPLVIFPLRPNGGMLPQAIYNVARERMRKGLSEQEQGKLLDQAAYLFFDFYSNFNFKLNGICIRTGKAVDNTGGSPLLIQNPLDRTLNVTKQVGDKEIRKMKMYFYIAKELYKKNKCFNANFMDENYYVKEMAELTKVHSQESRNVVEGHDTKTVTIGEVTKDLFPPKKPQYAPHKYLSMGELSQTTLRHLRWMLQKDLLGQDIFLIGRPGSTRRQLAMVYLEMTGREVEYICLSRDTTEADLKQRREIKNGTAVYFDQSAVRAAIEGRVLILEGVEKAERNVLPILNNLLENREMHLEDGRFLIPSSRYDKLLKDHSQEELDKWNLVRVNENFRVIALGLPIPKYSGNPLDPPLRSRFQARNISHRSYEEQLNSLKGIAPNVDPAKLSQLLSCSYALVSDEAIGLGLPDFPVDNVPLLGKVLNRFPNLDPSIINRLYPYRSFLAREGLAVVEETYNTFQISTVVSDSKSRVENVRTVDNFAECTVRYGNSDAQVKVPCGSLDLGETRTEYVPTDYQESVVVDLLQSHLTSDFCLIGPRGCGKSATVLRLASLLNYEVEQIVLYQDITSRDLLQQRNTLPNGDTIWQNSPLVQAALEGKLAILDGIDRVHSSVLSVIHRLVQDREVQLYDGKRLIRHDRYDEIRKKHNLSEEDMLASGTLRIHPSFRIVALAEPSKQGSSKGNWLTAEMISLFLFHEMRPLSNAEENKIINKLYGRVDAGMGNISKLATFLRKSEDPILASLSGSFSTRQLLRMAKRLEKYPTDSTFEAVQKACLARFLPPLAQEALDKALEIHGITASNASDDTEVRCSVDDDKVTIGKTTVPRYVTATKTKVPDIVFYDVPQHLRLMEWLLQDFTLGEHLLLVGNQGVGKNKIADRLLQLLNRPREYIQLHRDTTVQTLTLQPTVKDGVVTFEDSPLVQAVKQGHVLVIDEADKAPTHVTCILKTLVERGEMSLSDGRKIVPKGHARAKEKGIIEVHPDFRMIVLANRPGFPFLGNDFFGALGDLFSSHVVDNPSSESEVALLKYYGPDVPEETILKLVKAFAELRNMSDKGLVQYPYSTREVVNIVKHLQQFPKEGLGTVVKNVFDFDEYSSSALETLIPVLQKHGIPVGARPENVFLSKELELPKREKIGNWTYDASSRSVIPAEIKNIKVSTPVHLPVKRASADIVQSRSSKFTELTSYWSLPMAENDLVLGLAVTQGNDFSKDLIHVLTGNPVRLFVSSTITGRMRIFTLERHIPIIGYDRRFKFTLTPLAHPKDNFLLLHEGNSNYLALINVTDGVLHNLDLTSFSEKIVGKVKKTSYGEFRISSQLSDQNTVIVYGVRQTKMMVLDFNQMNCYNIDLPFRITTVLPVSENNWLIQDMENKKYMFKKKSPQDAVPSVLEPIFENVAEDFDIGPITGSSRTDLETGILTNLIGESITAPNRFVLSDKCYGSLIVGFPDLDSSENEVYSWFRSPTERGLKGKSVFLSEINQIATPVSIVTPPEKLVQSVGGLSGFLEVVDLKKGSIRYIRVPKSNDKRWYIDSFELGLFVAKTSNSGLVTVDRQGCLQFWEVSEVQLKRSLDEWMKMVGTDRENLQLTIERDSGKDVSSPKHGKVDPKNEPHVGGNTWAGGTGGRDTAGLGGKGGPYRLDAGHDVHQISEHEKAQVPEEVRAAAREMNRRVYKQRLNEIRMSEYDDSLYRSYSTAVAKQVEALRVIINNVQAKTKEREWARHQTSGDLDDLKLIEGLAGEKTIYRRRTEREPDPGAPLTKPKKLKLIVDVSASMYRFNGYDKRLQRVMEASIMVMEAFHGYDRQFKYDIIGHSGETYNLEFVSSENPPKNNKERLEVVKLMYAHSQFCLSGDHTLPATIHAIEKISKEDCDEGIVVILSDANLDHYNISAKRFGQILTSNPEVNAFAIFIGSLGNQAVRLMESLPAGRAFVCLDLSQIPQILQQIFSYSLLYKS